jgi:hypothetical protein
MVILKAHSKKEPTKFIGAFLPQWIHGYFAMYTLAKGVSKSELIRNLIEEWIKQQRLIVTDKELLDDILHNVRQEWKLERIGTPTAKLCDFKISIRAELKSRGLGIEQIETILKEIE